MSHDEMCVEMKRWNVCIWLELIARRKLCKNVDLEMELWKMGLVVCWRALDRFLIRKNWALVARGKDDKDRCMGNTRKRRRERIEFGPRLLFLYALSISLNGYSFFCTLLLRRHFPSSLTLSRCSATCRRAHRRQNAKRERPVGKALWKKDGNRLPLQPGFKRKLFFKKS